MRLSCVVLGSRAAWGLGGCARRERKCGCGNGHETGVHNLSIANASAYVHDGFQIVSVNT
jgi:hypothetical protein